MVEHPSDFRIANGGICRWRNFNFRMFAGVQTAFISSPAIKKLLIERVRKFVLSISHEL